MMDDSDDEVCMVSASTSRAARMEKRNQLNREVTRDMQKEEEELRLVLELSRKQAEAEAENTKYQEWEEWEDHKLPGNEQPRSAKGGERVASRQSTAGDKANHSRQPQEPQGDLDMDEDRLLESRDGSSDDEKRSVKSEIILDSDVEDQVNTEETANPSGTSGCSNPNLSRTSEASGASLTFPGNHLNRRPIKMEEEEEEGEETQLLDPSEAWGEPDVTRGKDEAGIGREGVEDECNASQDLFSQEGQESQTNDITEANEDAAGKAATSKEDSDDDFVMAEEDFTEEMEVRKSSRLSLKRKRGADDGANRTSKATRTEEGEERETKEDKERKLKEEIEKLVNGPFTLMQSHYPEDEERLKDNRKPKEPLEPYYCPYSVKPEEYSVAIVQMFQCYFKRLRSHRQLSSTGQCWGNPVHPGPHFVRYPIFRRRGFKGPPSDDDSDQETDVVEGQGGDTGVARRKGGGREDMELRNGDISQKTSTKINHYVFDEDGDVSDFQPVKVSGRRKLIMDSDLNGKRPRSEPHPIVCPKPLKRRPIHPEVDTEAALPGGGRAGPENDRGRPPTPTGKTFDFGGELSPRINSPVRGNLYQAPGPGTPSRRLRRSSSNPEFGSDRVEDSPLVGGAADSHPQDRDVAGPSRRVAYVQPSSSSPWISKASARAGNGSGSSGFVPFRDMEGGFIREGSQRMDTQEAMPSLDLGQPFVDNASAQLPGMPSPLRVAPRDSSPGIECPLCSQMFPISVIEAHASECDGTISLDDAVGNREPIREGPKRAAMTNSPFYPDSPPEAILQPKNNLPIVRNNESVTGSMNDEHGSTRLSNATRPTGSKLRAAKLAKSRQDTRNNDIRHYGAGSSDAVQGDTRSASAKRGNTKLIETSFRQAAKSNGSGRNGTGPSRDGHGSTRSAGSKSREVKLSKTRNCQKGSGPEESDNTRMDYIDAAILQLKENEEITIVEPKKCRPRASRTIPSKHEDPDSDLIEIEDFDDDKETSSDRETRPRQRGKVPKQQREKCYLCDCMIPVDRLASHMDHHEELKGQDMWSSSKDKRLRVDRRAPSPERLTNGESSSEDRHLRQIYGGPGGKRATRGSNLKDSPEWTQPGTLPSDDEGSEELDSPIKAYQSIKDTDTAIDFKNQFKESNAVRSRAEGRGRGRGRRGRGRGRRGRGRRKKTC